MIIDTIIKAELTSIECDTLQKAIDVIDTLINEMEDNKLSRIFTEYDGFTIDDLEEIARNLHSLQTVNEAD